MKILHDYELLSRNDQEIVLSYDFEERRWWIFCNNPAKSRKWEELLDEISDQAMKGYRDNGELIMISGPLLEDVNVTVHKKRELSEEQRAAAAERLRNVRQAQQEK